MARPVVISYRDGEVICKNLKPEDNQFVRELLIKSEPMLKPWEEALDKSQCVDFAYSMTKNGNDFLIVEVKYNAEKKWSYVSQVINVGPTFYVAQGEMKMLLGKNVIDKYFKI